MLLYGFSCSQSNPDILAVVSDRIARAFNRLGAQGLIQEGGRGVDGVASHPSFKMKKKIKKVGFPQTLS